MIAITNRLPVRDAEAADQLVSRFSGNHGSVERFAGFRGMEVLKAQDGSEVLVVTWWESREDFQSWVESDEFKRAHSNTGGEGLLSGRPQMGSYEVAVERSAG